MMEVLLQMPRCQHTPHHERRRLAVPAELPLVCSRHADLQVSFRLLQVNALSRTVKGRVDRLELLSLFTLNAQEVSENTLHVSPGRRDGRFVLLLTQSTLTIY